MNDVYAIQYILDGVYHREDGPALTLFYDDGTIMRKEHFINGKYHNDNGAVIVAFNEDGLMVYPTFIRQTTDGEIKTCFTHGFLGEMISESHYLNGVLHRTDGPAVHRHAYKKMKEKKEYYLYGKALSKEEWEEKQGKQIETSSSRKVV